MLQTLFLKLLWLEKEVNLKLVFTSTNGRCFHLHIHTMWPMAKKEEGSISSYIVPFIHPVSAYCPLFISIQVYDNVLLLFLQYVQLIRPGGPAQHSRPVTKITQLDTVMRLLSHVNEERQITRTRPISHGTSSSVSNVLYSLFDDNNDDVPLHLLQAANDISKMNTNVRLWTFFAISSGTYFFELNCTGRARAEYGHGTFACGQQRHCFLLPGLAAASWSSSFPLACLLLSSLSSSSKVLTDAKSVTKLLLNCRTCAKC